jgi:hypothetical protein
MTSSSELLIVNLRDRPNLADLVPAVPHESREAGPTLGREGFAKYLG